MVLVLVMATPLWFPWLLVLVARLNGVSIGDHTRVGFSRLRLEDVQASLAGQVFQAKSLEIPQPLTWLLAIARTQDAAPTTPLWVLRVWNLQPSPETNTSTTRPRFDSLASVLDQAGDMAHQKAWLGGTVLAESGRVEIAGLSLQVPTIEIAGQAIHATVQQEEKLLRVSVTQAYPGRVEARASLSPGDLLLQTAATRTGAAWTVTGTLLQHTNRVSFQAVTQPGAWLPTTAIIEGDAWSLPLPKELPGSVQVQARADWKEGRGSFDLHAFGSLCPPRHPTPFPLSIDVQGQLHPQAITITKLIADWSFATARLGSHVRVYLQEPQRVSSFMASAQVQSSAVPSWGFPGNMTLSLQSPETNVASFGRGITFDFLAIAQNSKEAIIRNLGIVGRVQWPEIHLDRLETSINSQMRLYGGAKADISRMEVLNARWILEVDASKPTAPATFRLPAFLASGSAAGPFTNLVQSGRVQSVPGDPSDLGPSLRLDARWRSRGMTLEEVSISTSQGNAELQLRGHASFQKLPSASLRGEWTQIDWTTAGQTELALTHPLAFSLNLPNPSTVVFRLPKAQWKGKAGELHASTDIEWPNRGRFQATLRDLAPHALSTWLPSIPSWIAQGFVRHLDVAGSWDEGPLHSSASLDASMPVPEIGTVRVQGSVAASADGVQFKDWTLLREEIAGPRFSATLPLRFHPARGLRDGWEPIETPLLGTLTLSSNTWPWSWLATRTGADLTQASARFDLSGTLAEPRLQMEWGAKQARLQIPSRETNAIVLGSIAAQAHAASDGIVLESLTLDVEGQTVRAEATIPWQTVTNGGSTTWAARWMPNLQGAEGQLDLPEASVSALAKPLENYLQPGGTLRGHIERRDAVWHGWLELTNVLTRPIPALGILRDIDLRLVWADDKLQIERGQASLGGQLLTLSGAWTLPDHPSPEAGLRLTATNLAIVRSPELILRADLDLTLSLARTNPSPPPVVGGLVTLHDSVVTMDVRDLVAVDLERPRQRPPFFSVEQPLVTDWTLDVRVRGDRFARILSPILKASASADLNLRGTLGQPKLVGQAFVDRGRLAFPFGQLEIQQFRVLFAEAEPYRPRLEGKAEGLSFGYNLSMELGGTLAEPEIGFSSTPPMTTSEVLQMLMAGSLPRNEYSYSTSGKAQNVGTYLAGDLLTQLAGDPMEEPRLTFRSAQRVSANGSLTYSVEYRLSDRWSAVAEYDRWNQLGAGVRWRVLEK